MSREIEIIKREPAVIPPNAERIWVKLDGAIYSVLLSFDDLGWAPSDGRWHVSVSKNEHLERDDCHDVPVWRDFVAIVHFIKPGVTFSLPIPAASMWMNKNPNVLHAYQMKDYNLEAEIRSAADIVRGTQYGEPT